jgi:hypothetical protein
MWQLLSDEVIDSTLKLRMKLWQSPSQRIFTLMYHTLSPACQLCHRSILCYNLSKSVTQRQQGINHGFYGKQDTWSLSCYNLSKSVTQRPQGINHGFYGKQDTLSLCHNTHRLHGRLCSHQVSSLSTIFSILTCTGIAPALALNLLLNSCTFSFVSTTELRIRHSSIAAATTIHMWLHYILLLSENTCTKQSSQCFPCLSSCSFTFLPRYCLSISGLMPCTAAQCHCTLSASKKTLESASETDRKWSGSSMPQVHGRLGVAGS